METFAKPPLTLDQMIDVFKIRGLAIPDETKAKHYLATIGYYRLGVYCKAFQQSKDPQHNYRPGVTFEDVLELYIFDRKLRLLAMDAIERIEVAVRTRISDVMALAHGSHWYTDSKHFVNERHHAEFIAEVRDKTGKDNPRNRSAFSNSYYNKYSSPELPPSWMIAESLTIGAWSRLYANLKETGTAKEIASGFIKSGPVDVFTSWLHALTFLRNVCAHHAVLWNRSFSPAPVHLMIAGRVVTNTETFYAFSGMIQRFLAKIAPDSSWAERLFQLFNESPFVSLADMGFPQNWHSDVFWNVTVPAGRTKKT